MLHMLAPTFVYLHLCTDLRAPVFIDHRAGLHRLSCICSFHRLSIIWFHKLSCRLSPTFVHMISPTFVQEVCTHKLGTVYVQSRLYVRNVRTNSTNVYTDFRPLTSIFTDIRVYVSTDSRVF